MNERIRELANIAAGRNIKTSPAVASDIADWAVIEKFAELLVKECADLVPGATLSAKILEHFGVK